MNMMIYIMRARYYDADTGRFFKEDPAGVSDGINVYTYVYNNPINYADPTGLGGYSTSGRIEQVCIICYTPYGRIVGYGNQMRSKYKAMTERKKVRDEKRRNKNEMERKQRIESQRTFGNSDRENRQAKDAANAAGGLTKDQKDILHNEIGGQGYNYQEILEIARDIKNGRL